MRLKPASRQTRAAPVLTPGFCRTSGRPLRLRFLWLAFVTATGCLPAFAPAIAGSFAFVTNQNSSDLSVLDLEQRLELRRIPVPGKPAGVAVAPGLGAFYTVSPDSKTVRAFSLITCEEMASVKLPGGPTGIAVDPVSNRVFVSDWYNARIFVLHGPDLKWVSDLPAGSAPAGLVVSADGSWLASADRDADQISIFDLDSMTLKARIDVGVRPFGLNLDPQGRLHVANVGTDTVTVVDPITAEVLGTVSVGARPYGVAFAGGKAFTTDQYADTVSIYSLETLEPLGKIDVGEYPEGIGTAINGELLVSTNWFSNTVSLIDPHEQVVLGEIETGDGPRAFGHFILETPTGERPCDPD